jgi:transcriptional regulator GlxA family with amidase domain
MDLSLALVEEDLGTRCRWTSRGIWCCSSGVRQSGAVLDGAARQAAQSPELRALQTWIADNLGRDLSVGVLASRWP